MRRVVCDTNVLVSGLLWKGNKFQVLRLASEGKVELCVSREILAELARVLHYPRLEKFVGNEERLLLMLARFSTVVEPREHVFVIQDDPSDDKILECALAAKADYLVSGDKHLLKLKKFYKTRIVTARKFLERLSKTRQNP